MRLRFLLTLLCLYFGPASYAERWYEIEVILFEQANEERLANESWEQQPALADLSKLKDIISQPPHLQRIDNLCYQGTYYQVKTIPTVTEVLADETVPIEAEAETATIDTVSNETDEEFVIEKPFQLLPKSEHELSDVYAQLRRRRGYRMLFHEAWRQPMQSEKEALPLRFYAGENYGEKYTYDGALRVPPETGKDATSSVQGVENFTLDSTPKIELVYQQPNKYFRTSETTHGLMNVDRHYQLSEIERAKEALKNCQSVYRQVQLAQAEPVWQIDGYIKFYAERFRHIETNLALRIPGVEEISLEEEVIDAAVNDTSINDATNNPDDEVIATEKDPTNLEVPKDWQLDERLLTDEPEKLTEIREVLAHYTMQQKRRIIDERIHYFDHPLLGVILQMRLYDPEEAAKESNGQ